MRNSTLFSLAAAVTTFATIATANADVIERDHRAAPSAAPEVRVYRRRPGPRFMMPLKVDIGMTGTDTDRGLAQGIAASVGIHWASLSPRPTDLDVGVGVFGALLGAPKDPMGMNDSNGIAYGGVYVEAGHTLAKGDWWRTWASGRGEYLGSTAFGGDNKAGFGVAGRLSAELYASGAGIEPRGLFLGTYAVGLYTEVGVRDVVKGVSDIHVTAGLTFRTPMVFSP